MTKSGEVIKVPAMAIQQSPGRTLYSFAVDGKQIYEFEARQGGSRRFVVRR